MSRRCDYVFCDHFQLVKNRFTTFHEQTSSSVHDQIVAEIESWNHVPALEKTLSYSPLTKVENTIVDIRF